MDDWPRFTQTAVDVFQAVGMPFAVVVKEIIHFRAAAGV